MLNLFNKRKYKPKMGHDSSDYHVLYNAARSIKGVEGFTCEIGLRQGGGTDAIIKGFLSNNDPRIHVGIDPYGQIPYRLKDGIPAGKFDYTNKMKIDFLVNIYTLCQEKGIDFLFFNMEDSEFFKRFADGIPVYDNEKSELVNKYALVHLDGPHTTPDVLKEAEWFIPRISQGGVLVFDDVQYYRHYEVAEKLIKSGFKVLEETDKKISYRKT